MGDKLITGVVGIVTAMIGVAIIAVLVSSKSNSSSVIGAAGKSFSQILGCALSPITGSGCGSSVSSSISFQ